MTKRNDSAVVLARRQRLTMLERENVQLRKRVARLEIDRAILEKCGGVLREGKRMKFAFIEAQKANFPVGALCAVLGVTRQGYHAYSKHPLSAYARSDAALLDEVQRIHDESRRTYGSPRVHAELRRRGRRVGKRRVERCMRAIGLAARPTTRSRRSSPSAAPPASAPNLLARDFAATRPNERWVCDITYVWTADGWCFVAIVLDLFSRAVVGWSIGAEITAALPLRALQSALDRRARTGLLLHHSDQGCQYTSREYRDVLAAEGITVSMSRRGNCWDNAVAESFFSTLKTELIERRPWSGRDELRGALLDYVEAFYNHTRLHSTLGYRPPAEVEQVHADHAMTTKCAA